MDFPLIKINIQTRESFICFLKLVGSPPQCKPHIMKTKSRNPVYYKDIQKSVQIQIRAYGTNPPPPPPLPLISSNIPHLTRTSLYCSGLRNLNISLLKNHWTNHFCFTTNNCLAVNHYKAVLLLFLYSISDSVFFVKQLLIVVNVSYILFLLLNMILFIYYYLSMSPVFLQFIGIFFPCPMSHYSPSHLLLDSSSELDSALTHFYRFNILSLKIINYWCLLL